MEITHDEGRLEKGGIQELRVRLGMAPAEDVGLKFLNWLCTRMLDAYQGEGDVEARARKAILVYEQAATLVDEIQRTLNRVRNLYQTLLKAIQELELARSRGDRRGRTISGHGCYVVKLVPCGKNCSGCPHGPYAYLVTKVGGKQVWKYLGRAQGRGAAKESYQPSGERTP